jgi:hypothetical protein
LVGFAELPADAWLVDYTRTLDYSIGGGPMIWRSPVWMPLAWEVVAVQFGYIGLRLWERFGKGGLLAIGCSAQSTFRSTKRWRAEFIGGNTTVAAWFRLRRGTSFSASSGLRLPWRCLRELCDADRGATLSSRESAAGYRSLFATPLRFGLRID